MIGLGLSVSEVAVRRHAVAAGEPTLEPNVWPQPEYDSDVGLTLQDAAISGGEISFFASESGPQFCAMTTPPAFVAGDVWHYSVTAPPANTLSAGFKFEIGGASVDLGLFLSGATVSGQVTIPATPVNVARLYEPTGFYGGGLTATTLQRQA